MYKVTIKCESSTSRDDLSEHLLMQNPPIIHSHWDNVITLLNCDRADVINLNEIKQFINRKK